MDEHAIVALTAVKLQELSQMSSLVSRDSWRMSVVTTPSDELRKSHEALKGILESGVVPVTDPFHDRMEDTLVIIAAELESRT